MPVAKGIGTSVVILRKFHSGHGRLECRYVKVVREGVKEPFNESAISDYQGINLLTRSSAPWHNGLSTRTYTSPDRDHD